MSGPAVSVVLPTFNRAAMLPHAIASVQSQTWTDWELIVVDDCSTDNTAEILRQHSIADPRLRVIRNETNQKLPRSLNVGFHASEGRFLTWTSDDNIYHPEALARLIQALDRNPASGLAYSSMRIIDSEDRFIREFTAKPVDSQPIQPWVGACFLYRREVFEAVGDYDPEFFLAEDMDYWMRVRIQFAMVAVPEILYDYRDHPDSLTANYQTKIQLAGARVVEKHLDKIDWLTPENRAQTLLGLADAALLRKDGKAARTWIKLAATSDRGVVMRSFKRQTVRAFLGL